MDDTVEKLVHIDCDLYAELDKACFQEHYIDFVMKNKWTLLNILEKYAEAVKEISVDG